MTTKIDIAVMPFAKDLPIPKHEEEESAGIDLRAASIPENTHVVLNPGQKMTFSTGIKMAIPKGYLGLAAPRSGIGTKHDIVLANTVGIIDSSYRGQIMITLRNTSDKEFVIRRGDRLVQLVIVPYLKVQCVIVDELSATERGEGGHGSTGNE